MSNIENTASDPNKELIQPTAKTQKELVETDNNIDLIKAESLEALFEQLKI